VDYISKQIESKAILAIAPIHMLMCAAHFYEEDNVVIDTKREKNSNWLVYIILCSDDSLYTGITTDIERRFSQHVAGTGAKYFRGRSPRHFVYLEGDHDRSSASRREAEIKRLRADDKWLLIASSGNDLKR